MRTQVAVLGNEREREEVNRSHITRGEEHGNSEPTFRHTATIIIVVAGTHPA